MLPRVYTQREILWHSIAYRALATIANARPTGGKRLIGTLALALGFCDVPTSSWSPNRRPTCSNDFVQGICRHQRSPRPASIAAAENSQYAVRVAPKFATDGHLHQPPSAALPSCIGLATLVVACMVAACNGDAGRPPPTSNEHPSAGSSATGGYAATTGGGRNTGGNPANGGSQAAGGAAPYPGGASYTGGSPTDGGTHAVGGAAPATGGASYTGGSPATGGTRTAGGAAPAAAGTSNVVPGGASHTGGSAATGGTRAGGSAGRATGGAIHTGGSPNTGGIHAGGGAGRATGGTSSVASGGSATGGSSAIQGLSWPIDCIPNQTCAGNLGYPDIDNDGAAYNCSAPGYQGHEGTDIGVSVAAQDAGTAVWAAADGVVLFAFDGKYDKCPNANEPDCQNPSDMQPGETAGTTVCTPLGPYCGSGSGSCFWCFAGGNVIVIRHSGVRGVFATRYDHLKRNSLMVRPGDSVNRGQKIAEVGSAGNSSGPHLHFEVWGTGFYELAEPWAGSCGPNRGPSLWAMDPPWGG